MTEEKKRKAKWQNDYINKAYDRINLTVPKGEKENIKAHAESRGESVNAFINRAITETMIQDTRETPKKVEDVAAMYPTPNQIQKIRELKEQRKKQGE